METHTKLEKIKNDSRKSYIRYAVILPIIALAGLSTLQYLFTDSFFKPGLWIFWYTLPVTVVTGILMFAKPKQPKWALFIYAVVFHAVIAAFLIFVAPINSGFTYIWALLVFGLQINFKKRALLLSYVGLLATLLIGLIYRDALYASALIDSAVNFVLVFAICQLMLQTRSTEQRELSELNLSLNRELYERQRLLSLINNMGEAVVATDKSGKVLLYNAAVLNLLDTNQTLEGKQIDTLLKLRDTQRKVIKVLDLLKDKPAGFTSTDYIHEFTKDDTINVYLNIAPIKLGFKEESGSGYIVIMRDITREKSLEEERDEFISVVSHELRTPVAIAEGNISNAIFMNQKTKDTKMVSESLDQAHDQVVFLANMINDLATLSRAERTDVKVELSEVDPKVLLHNLARDYEGESGAKGLKLTASAANDTQVISTSELYLHEVLQNFVTNAIKYTKKGSIILHVRSSKAGDAVFSVADSGIGLSKADQKRVFDKFFRSEDFRTRESSGTGLGLYVTAKLAHKLNAQITLESELNKGSTFTITVPSQEKHRKN